MTPIEKQWIFQAATAAIDAQHIFPRIERRKFSRFMQRLSQMEDRVMLQHLKAWWATHVTWIAVVASFLTPSINSWVSQHPADASLVGGAWAILLHHLQPPRNFQNSKGGNSLKHFASIILLAMGFCLLPSSATAQNAAPPVQHFVLSTTAGSFGGNPVAIVSSGVQLTDTSQIPVAIAVAYEFISNPNDSSQPRVGSGLANGTFSLASIFPASIKKKLIIDLTNYNLTVQAGAGVESLWNAGLPRTSKVVGNFGLFPSYPLPGGHAQISVGYKWIVGGRGGLIRIPTGTLNFTL